MESEMRRVAGLLVILLLLGSLSGCRLLPLWPRAQKPCTLRPDASKQEIAAHVNRFVSPAEGRPPLTAWRATDAHLSMKGAPPLEASIDVEAPSRIRIRASMPFSHTDLADMGANEEEIWFWGMGAKEVVTVRHEDLPYALQQMQIPFEPEWLMEVLGVVPLDLSDFEPRPPVNEERWLEFAAHRVSPTGEPLVRVIRIDLCHGHVLEHRIEREDGTLIASARLGDYSPDVSGQYELPHVVQIEWPVTDTSLTLRLGAIHANPPSLGDEAWSGPLQANLPRRRLVRPATAPVRQAGRDGLRPPVLQTSEPGLVRLGSITEADTEDEPPAAYSPAAWQSSSDPRRPEPESGPRPFP